MLLKKEYLINVSELQEMNEDTEENIIDIETRGLIIKKEILLISRY